MNGRFLPAKAVYPLQSASGFDLNLVRVWIVAFVGEEDATICAFCFITSAGVRMAHDTNSAMDDAPAWRMGVGIRPVGEDAVLGFKRAKRDFVRS